MVNSAEGTGESGELHQEPSLSSTSHLQVRTGAGPAVQAAVSEAPKDSTETIDTPETDGTWKSSRFELPRHSPRFSARLADDGATSSVAPVPLGRVSAEESGRRTPLSPRPGDGAAAQKSWARRVQAKTEELRKTFGLDASEQLMDDFMCALRKKILLQGRLFVFERHLCFYSSLFGYQKAKVVPLEAVVDVVKKKNVGFPNSIEVLWEVPGSGALKTEFFTSFLNRRDAYRLILGLWGQCSERGRQRAAAEEAHTEEEDAGRGGGGAGGQGGGGGGQWRSISAASGGAGEEAFSEGGGAATPTDGGGRARLWERSLSPMPGDGVASDGDGAESSMMMGGDGSMMPAAHGSGPQQVPEFEELSSHLDPSKMEAEFDAAEGPPPPLPDSMQRVLTCSLPVSPRGFYRAFLASASDFFTAFHQSQGHHSIKLSPWQRHYRVGPVRDLRFVTPLKGWRIGPPQALCHQTQRYRVYSGESLVFETSQVMSDIPYGDHFKVETRWDIAPGEAPNTCNVQVHIAVPFTKSTLWRKFIEKSVTDSSLEAYQMFCELADRQLAEAPAGALESGAPTARGGPPAAAAAAPPPGSTSPAQALTVASTLGAAAGSTPGHRRQPSRPSSPEEVLPSTNEEWEMLLSQVEPQWRGGLRSLRRTQLNPTASPAPRHRRRGSNRSVDFHAFGLPPVASSPRLPRLAERTSPARSQELPPLTEGGGDEQPTLGRRWPAMLLCLLGATVICLQFALLALQLHRQPPAVFNFEGAGGAGAGAEAAAAVRAAVGNEVGALAAQLQRLQRDAQAWRGQLDGMLDNCAALAERAQQLHRAVHRPA